VIPVEDAEQAVAVKADVRATEDAVDENLLVPIWDYANMAT
jgi:hypothetical protein